MHRIVLPTNAEIGLALIRSRQDLVEETYLGGVKYFSALMYTTDRGHQ